MRRAAVALAGAGLGLFSTALARALEAYFWPLAALGLMHVALVAGGVAALAIALAPPEWRERLRGRGYYLALTGAVAAVAAVAATDALANRLHPGAGLGLRSFPPLYLLALVVPFAAAGIALTSWCGEYGRRRRGWFLCGIGAGVLGASFLAGAQSAFPPPWSGEPLLDFSTAGGGAIRASIDRGLREFLVGPKEAELAFPLAGGTGGQEILMVGLANGPVLAQLVRNPEVRITMIEGDASLVHAVFARWPELPAAVAAGRLTIMRGAERWELARIEGRFDLIVLGGSWSPAAYGSRALSHRRDHRWTKEAFARYLTLLKPHGRMLVQRTGVGRVVATLRDAAGLPAAEFARRVVVIWRWRGIPSECWYSPAGLDSPELPGALRQYRKRNGGRILYTPLDVPPGRYFFLPLIRGERLKGLVFSTPLDLSPALDERPFFDHAERMLLSPRLRGMQEELQPLAGHAGLRILPAADRSLWGILVGGLAFAACLAALGGRGARRGERSCLSATRLPAAALWCGAAAGLIVEAFNAWSEWLAPGTLAAAGARAALFAGLGAGWALSPRMPVRWLGCAPPAALAALLGVAGYRALPMAVRLGPIPGAVAVIAAGALLGLALGRAFAVMVSGEGDPAAGAEATRCGAALAAASSANLAATLAAPHFGYPLLWILGAVALLAPVLGRRSRAPGVPGAAT